MNMDENRFLELINQHQVIIHKICRLYRDLKEDREDLFQEIVFQLWKSVSTFDGRSQFSTWMYRVALSTAIAVYRKKKPGIQYHSELPDRAEEQEQENEQHELLLEAIKKLNDGDKALILLYLEDLSYKEIAEITGITENNVGVRLKRIRDKIQQLTKN
jgi:RNA polymerase sigma factor (sigma-70 family)